MMAAVEAVIAAGYVLLFLAAITDQPPRTETPDRARPWRRPASGGYQLDTAQPEPTSPPRGRAGTSR